VIFAAAAKAVGQLADPRFWGVLALGLGLTAGLLLAFCAAVVALVGRLLPDAVTLPWIGPVAWLDDVLVWTAIPLVLLLSTVLMAPVAAAFTGLFLDRIADAVEARHYPHLPPARRIGLAEGLGDGLRFLGVVLAANLAASVAYIAFAPIAPVLFWAVNGALLGREYGQMVALRRTDGAGAAAFRRAHRGTLFAAGVLMAAPLTIPVVNLLVPVLGAATFTHLHHRLTGDGDGGPNAPRQGRNG